jgi:cytochrome P450
MFGYSLYTCFSVIVAVVAIGIVILLKYLARNDDYWKQRGVPYIPRMNIFKLLKVIFEAPLHELQMKFYKKFTKTKYWGGYEMSTPVLAVADPDLLRDILVKDFHIFPHRRDITLGDKITDNMVSILKGEDWKRVRTTITPAFTSKRMRQMSSIINDCSMSVVKSCEKHFMQKQPIECKSLFGAYTMDVIASAAFATKINSYDDPENEFVKRVREVSSEPTLKVILMSLIIPTKLAKYFGLGGFSAMDFFKNVTLQVIKDRKETGKKYNDVLQILMDAANENALAETTELHEDEEDKFGSINSGISPSAKHKRLSEDELLAQCILFFFVGYETTASTLTFMAYALALNAEWQDKLIAEVDEAFQKHKEMSYDAVRDMKILDGVVSETLRMYPAVIGSERTAIEDYKLGNTGVIIEKGKRIAFPIYSMHYDQEYFEDPEKFNPNRFIDPNQMKHPPYAYQPFGSGPRNCLGMRFALLEIKLCMTNILRNFRFRIHSTTKVPLQYKKGSPFISVNDLPLAVEKRTHI